MAQAAVDVVAQAAKLDAKLARIAVKTAAIDAEQAKHSCAGTLAGALTCKKCLGRKATTFLPSWQAGIVTDANLAALLEEYSGAAPLRRAVEEAAEKAAYARDQQRLCVCGHPLTSHASRHGALRSGGVWGAPNDCGDCSYAYYQKHCGGFREAALKAA
jgi:hypothetical protein